MAEMIAVSAAIAHLKHKASKEPADRHPRSIARSFSSAAIPGRRGALFEPIQLAGTILNISSNTKDPIHLYNVSRAARTVFVCDEPSQCYRCFVAVPGGWIGRLVRTAQDSLLRLRQRAVQHAFDYNNESLSRFWLNDSYAALFRRG